MRRRIHLVGALVGVCLLAFGAATATAASTKHKSKSHKVKKTVPSKPTKFSASCSSGSSIEVAAGDQGVTPPVPQGNEYGTIVCKHFGGGVLNDSFSIPDSGDTVANYWFYFQDGSLKGSWDLTPQEATFGGDPSQGGNGDNFTQSQFDGTMTITGGRGRYKGATGSGTMSCTTWDGIHTNCTETLQVTLPPKPQA